MRSDSSLSIEWSVLDWQNTRTATPNFGEEVPEVARELDRGDLHLARLEDWRRARGASLAEYARWMER